MKADGRKFLERLKDSRWGWFLHGLPVLDRAKAMFQVRRYTMTTPERCKHLWDVCNDVLERDVEGALVECGVWRGGSSALMGLAVKRAIPQRILHLFDSFEGLPEPTLKDGVLAAEYSGGRVGGKLESVNQCRSGIAEVRSLLLDRLRLKLIQFHEGWFQNTIPTAAASLGPIAVLRLDGDWYESTMVCLEYFYPLLSPGGVIILDDYYAWEGCAKATDEYRARYSVTSRIQRIDKDAAFWKVGG